LYGQTPASTGRRGRIRSLLMHTWSLIRIQSWCRKKKDST